jgi:hypothetical protein
MSVICDFDQQFQIVNIFYFKMADKNYKIIDILISYFLVDDHHLDDK